MNILLDSSAACSNIALASVLIFIKRALGIIQIIVPILLIIGLVIAFSKMVANPEEKKEPKKIINRIVAAVIIFIIPVLINILLAAIAEYGSVTTYNISRCWVEVDSNAVNLFTGDDAVTISQDIEEGKKITVIDTEEYEESTGASYVEPENNNNSNNSNSNNSTAPAATSFGGKIIQEAKKYLGNPYVWGGNSLTNGCDCSHFVSLVLQQLGCKVSYQWTGAWNQGQYVGTDPNLIQEGDIFVYHANGSGHMGFVDANKMLVEAKGSKYGITNDRSWSSYSASHPVKIYRFTSC